MFHHLLGRTGKRSATWSTEHFGRESLSPVRLTWSTKGTLGQAHDGMGDVADW